MQPYQQAYIDNCATIHRLVTSQNSDIAELTHARELKQENTRLLSKNLFPVLDDLYAAPPEIVAEMEEFSDKLNVWQKQVDVALSVQILEALVSVTRLQKDRTALIRRLYKLGRAYYSFYLVSNGIAARQSEPLSLRMRYSFSEAAGYLRFFGEFPAETQEYIVRAQANIYLGVFHDWRDKLACVRRSMQIVTDPYYHKLAPSLPWKRFEATIHQQMCSVFPYDKLPGALDPEMVVDVMESAHLVYEDQFIQLRKSGKPIQPRWLMPYYTLELACGLITREQLLAYLEGIFDSADETSYSSESIYAMLSAPAFYVQYLQFMPDLLVPRRRYLAQSYLRILRYIANMPPEIMGGEGSNHAMRMLETFIEVPGGITMLHFGLYGMRLISPEIFAHSYVTGRMSQRIAEAILAEDPSYFSDVPELQGNLSNAGRMAFFAGAMHDFGMLVFRNISGNDKRQMLHSEYEMRKTHAYLGKNEMASCESTKCFADTAYGHHRWYDGSDGYPDDYDRLESPYRAITDIVSLTDYLDSNPAEDTLEAIRSVSFDQKCADAIALGGRRFSPMVTTWLQNPALREKLADLYDNGYRRALSLPVPLQEDSKAFVDALYQAE